LFRHPQALQTLGVVVAGMVVAQVLEAMADQA
jgi:hypothetical protein